MNNDTHYQKGELDTLASVEEVYRATVDVASRLLNAAVCEVAIATGDELVVRESTATASDDSRHTYPLVTSIPGGSYSTQQVCLIDDCFRTRSAAQSQLNQASNSRNYRSILCVPIEDRGVLVAKAPSAGALSPADREIAERLVSAAEVALDRIGTTDPETNGRESVDDEESRLDVVAQMLSHDLQSPLNVVRGSLELAASTGDTEHYRRAAVALSRIEEFVDSVVVLARTGQHVTSVEPIDLAAALDRVQDVLPMENAELEIVESDRLLASEEVLRHLLENIVKNAIDHGGPSVTIRVGLTRDGFYVEDDGPGIAPERRETIFERGYSSAEGHNGLGLSIAKQLAEAHGWSIRVTEGSQGGARFELSGVEFAEG